MNLATLRTEAQRLAGRVDIDWNSRTRRFLNEAQEQWALSVPWPTLVRVESFTNHGTRAMVLPPRVRTVLWAADRTNKKPLLANAKWDKDYPDAYFGDKSGAAQLVREQGFVAVTRQPSSGVLSFKTDTSDVFSCYAGGLREDTTASGTPDLYYFDKEQVNISGSNVVAGSKTFVRVEALGKDDFTPSDVVVRDASSNVIARIPALGYRAEYRQIELMNIPSAGTLIDIGYVQAPPVLVDDYQTPNPSIDTEYLIWYAAGLIHEAQGQAEQAQVKLARAREILERRIYKERMHGEKDLRARPSYDYWGTDDQYISGYEG